MKHKDEDPTGLANAAQILAALNGEIRIEADRLAKVFGLAPHHVAVGATIAGHRSTKALAREAVMAILGEKAGYLAGVDGLLTAKIGFLNGYAAGVASIAELEEITEEEADAFALDITRMTMEREGDK